MSVLFYYPGFGEKYDRLIGEVERIVPVDELETYRTREALCQRLHKPRYDVVVGMLCAPSQQAFAEILSLRDLLDNLRIILLLPDDEKETTSRGFSLYPRYLGYIDKDPADVIAVLDNMISNNGRI